MRSDFHFPRLKTCLALVLALVAAGCVTNQKRLEQGIALEERGRPADAATRYVAVLRREPGQPEARAGLQRSGDQAMGEYLAEADALDRGGRPDEAAEALLRLDALRREASSVGVTLAVPADYEGRRRATLDRAIADAIAAGQDAGARGTYAEALRALERAERWQPSAGQRAQLVRARHDAGLAWAEGELRAGRFRAAYERAAEAERVLGGAGDGRAEALRREALDRGTVRVAVLPVAATPEARRKVHEDFLPELNDVLEQQAWTRPPLFVDVYDPVQAAREARRAGFGRQAPSTRDAAAIGRSLGVDLVVVAELDSVAAGQADVRSERRAARTREGVDTAYTVRQGRDELWGRVTFAVVDARAARVVDQGAVSARADARFRRAVYQGDHRSLSLTREERDLFDARGDDETARTLVRELSGGFSERLGRDVYELLLRMIY
jgi:tetratricopeptide (TPR) repeat protein